MISAVGEVESVVRCIELGAEDYLPKPFDATLLRARVGASLEKKRLRDEVRDWNRKLEERVQEQVAQLGRLGRLKGFFSPQLAESIINGGGEDLLKTHRREVVVVFLDLRGFTAFTDTSEPEEVMAVLGEYHRVMGQLILAHEGTLEHFAGDGILIFFNDPIELEKPAENAISMALEMQQQFAPLRDAWKKRGFDLDLGIGIAQGYATLGAIGFEGRWEYACIGSVANLASRLCNEAKGGQILINQKTLIRIEDVVDGRAAGRSHAEGYCAAGADVQDHRLEVVTWSRLGLQLRRRAQCRITHDPRCPMRSSGLSCRALTHALRRAPPCPGAAFNHRPAAGRAGGSARARSRSPDGRATHCPYWGGRTRRALP